jgi:hypothetical protein
MKKISPHMAKLNNTFSPNQFLVEQHNHYFLNHFRLKNTIDVCFVTQFSLIFFFNCHFFLPKNDGKLFFFLRRCSHIFV